MESSSTEKQEEIEQVEKTPVAKEKAQPPRNGGRTRSGRAVKKPECLGNNVMVLKETKRKVEVGKENFSQFSNFYLKLK